MQKEDNFCALQELVKLNLNKQTNKKKKQKNPTTELSG